MTIKIRQLSISLTLLAVVMLASCGKKPEDTGSNTPETTTSSSPTSQEESTSKHPGESKAKGKGKTVDSAAAQLGVKPTGTTTCPSDASVKGKITKKRGNIYHLAKTPDYDKTKPDICFKDKATAEKAGYRAPK
jgi:hypothetical protein